MAHLLEITYVLPHLTHFLQHTVLLCQHALSTQGQEVPAPWMIWKVLSARRILAGRARAPASWYSRSIALPVTRASSRALRRIRD
jgi:hypothetical protein